MTRSDPDLTQAVGQWLSLMWQHIDNTVRAMIGHHHEQHEPGGKDQVRIPVSFLSDVSAASPSNDDVLKYNSTNKLWVNGVGDGVATAAKHQAHLGLILPPSVIPPGPTNVSGAAYHVRAIRVAADGAVSGNVGGLGISYGFSFGAAGGDTEQQYSSNAVHWENHSTIGIDVEMPSTSIASWLTVDVSLED